MISLTTHLITLIGSLSATICENVFRVACCELNSPRLSTSAANFEGNKSLLRMPGRFGHGCRNPWTPNSDLSSRLISQSERKCDVITILVLPALATDNVEPLISS